MNRADDIRVTWGRGAAIEPHLDDVARLRLRVFRDWPYLYDGDVDYERRYLRRYARSADSILVLAWLGPQIVGAATGMPLADDEAEFQRPFVERGLAVESVYYFGESVLLRECRGRGIGHRFFDFREGFALALGYPVTAFAAVDRAADDPRRPLGYRPNDAFWSKRGYRRQPAMTLRLAWRELGESDESEKPLTFWLRAPEAREAPSGRS